MVEVYATMLAVGLGDPDEARRRSHDLDPDRIPSTTWRASHLVSLARGADQEGSAEGVLALLQRAVRVSPEVVQFSGAGGSWCPGCWWIREQLSGRT